MDVKTCSICGLTLPATTDFFYKAVQCKLGVAGTCIKCRVKQQKIYEESHPGNSTERARRHREKNRDKINSKRREQRILSGDLKREKDREYYNRTRENSIARQKKYKDSNKDKISEYSKAYREKNREYLLKKKADFREKIRESINKESREREKTDPAFRINRRFGSLLYQSMRKVGVSKNRWKWWDLVGYTTQELMAHIEKQFDIDMSWDNYGKWHIDHIIPKSKFNYKSVNDIDFKKCWALKNLRPMWAQDNLSKGCKLLKPFQPSLAFG